MDITVIKAEEMPELALLCANSARERKALDGILEPLDETGSLATLSAHLESGHWIWAAREGSRVLGYFVAGQGPGGVALLDLYVDAAHRRRGVARALFDRAVKLAGEQGGELIIEVHPNHGDLIAFLRAMRYCVLTSLRLRPVRDGESLNHSHRLGPYRFRSPAPISRRRLLADPALPAKKRKKKRPRKKAGESEWDDWGVEFGHDDEHYFIVGFTSGGAAYGVTWEQAWQNGLISDEKARDRGLLSGDGTSGFGADWIDEKLPF